MSNLLALMNSFWSCMWRLTCIPPRVTQKRCSEKEALAPFFDGFAPLRILKEPTVRTSIGWDSRSNICRSEWPSRLSPMVLPCHSSPQLFYLPGWHSSDADTQCPFRGDLHLQGLAVGHVCWWWWDLKGLPSTLGFGDALAVLLCIFRNKAFSFSLQQQRQDCQNRQKIGGCSESGCPGKYTGNIGKEPVSNKENGITLPSIRILDVQ